MTDKEKVTLLWKTKLQKIGNSHAVIIPKTILKKMGFDHPGEVTFKILTDGHTLVLIPS